MEYCVGIIFGEFTLTHTAEFSQEGSRIYFNKLQVYIFLNYIKKKLKKGNCFEMLCDGYVYLDIL